MAEKDPKAGFREWLEKLQQESWQLELLISGFAIFGIYQSRTLIADLEFARSDSLDESSFWMGILVFIFKKGWLIFFLNLLIHVVLRGLWIGAIGLRYVSGEIDYDRFQYSDIFTRFLKKSIGSYDDFIEKLERVCSVIFAYTFLLFLLFMSFMLFLMQIGFIANMIQRIDPNSSNLMTLSGLAVIIYFILGSIVFFDLISIGGFKKVKHKWFSTIYFFLYRFFGFMTLSFLYRPLLYNFIDNSYTKKLFYFSIPYIFLVGFGDTILTNIKNPYKADESVLLQHGELIDENLYDDLRLLRLSEFPNEQRKISKEALSWISMEQFEITKNLTSFFIRMDRHIIRNLDQDTTISPYFKSGYAFTIFNAHILSDKGLEKIRNEKNISLKDLYTTRRKLNALIRKHKDKKHSMSLDSIKNLISAKETYYKKKTEDYLQNKLGNVKKAILNVYSFSIDETQLEINQSYFYNHPHYGEEGIKCFFETDSLSPGLHEFKVIRKLISRRNEMSIDSIIFPFIKM